MSTRPRFAHRPMFVTDTALFQTAEEAWFWFIQCQQYRHEGGAPIAAMGSVTRPCDPDDVYRAVMSLYRQRRLSAAHLRTLSQYGLAERAPDSRCREEETSTQLWDEAMGELLVVLQRKGIIE